MICLDGFLSADLGIRDRVQETIEGELMLAVVDLSAEQSGAGAVLFRVPQHVEGVERSSRAATEDTDNDAVVVRHELFHGGGAEIRNFQE